MTNNLSPTQIAQYNAKHKENRDIDIFTGICIGMLCDGHVNSVEMNYMADWISKNPHVAGKYPVSAIAKNIDRWLADGKIDDDEELELLGLLRSIASGDVENSELFCSPEPAIRFGDTQFAFTGNFSASRGQLEKVVLMTGSTICKKEITNKTDYLIVGETGSENWKHNGAGTKIVKAVSFRDNGHKIKIIRERHFVTCLQAFIEELQDSFSTTV